MNPSCSARLKMRFGPSGIHLFSRDSGLNVLIDEVVPPAEIWTKAPRHVSIALTNACDLSCAHCYAPKSYAVLPYDRLIDWIEELDEAGTIGIGFGGGEPTLYPRFAELCARISTGTAVAVSFTTHGHHLTDSLLTDIANTVNFVRVSVDGIGTTYERIRGKSFIALQHRLRMLRTVTPFGINYLVNSMTFPDLTAALEFAADIGATEFLLLPEQPVDGRPGIDSETMRALGKWVSGYRGSVRLAISESGATGIATCDPLARDTGFRAMAHIDAHGVLKRSSFDKRGISIGSEGILRVLERFQIDGEAQKL